MILLKRCLLNDANLYNISASDGPSNGSKLDLYKNIVEMSNMLDPFEIVQDKTKSRIEFYNLNIDDNTAIELIKPFYQQIRHGLAFDWIMNYCMKLVLDYMPPNSPYFVFKGTLPFIEQFKDDVVFTTELNKLKEQLLPLLQWVAGNNDISHLPTLIESDTEVGKRSHYLVFLLEMLSISIGPGKLNHWSEQFNEMVNNHPKTEGDVIVVGGHFRLFAFGTIDDDTNKWYEISNGITMTESYRTQRKDYVRVFPDEMTFVRFENSTMMIDETYHPTISIDNGEFLSAVEFGNNGISVVLDVPHTLTISYKFKQDINNPKQIKIKGGENCVIKDSLITLDETGKCSTQIVFRGNSVTFKISDVDKKYPFSFFTTKKIQQDGDKFAWL